jgi:Kdo2-lipid IVA lauroyltransferase/acyltransferase
MAKNVKGAEFLKFHHVVEYGFLRVFLGFCMVFGLDRGSALCGWMARTLGPLSPPHKTAIRNMSECMPELSDAEVRTNVMLMWENFGRTMVELPQLHKLLPYREDSRTEVVNGEIADDVLANGKGAIFISGHFANWEMLAPCIRLRGYDLDGVYRSANNPLVNKWTMKLRGPNSFSSQSPKGRAGAKLIVGHIRSGTPVAMLVDQKMNDGIEAPFFDKPSMTAGAAAQMSEKYDCPIVPLHIRRINGVHFRVEFYPPIEIEKSGNKADDILALTTAYNKFLEDRIREVPSQWMWMHNRWTDSKRAEERRKQKAAKAARASKTDA